MCKMYLFFSLELFLDSFRDLKRSIYFYFVKFYIRFTSEDIEDVVEIIDLSFGSSVATRVSCVSVHVAATERHS